MRQRLQGSKWPSRSCVVSCRTTTRSGWALLLLFLLLLADFVPQVHEIPHHAGKTTLSVSCCVKYVRKTDCQCFLKIAGLQRVPMTTELVRNFWTERRLMTESVNLLAKESSGELIGLVRKGTELERVAIAIVMGDGGGKKGLECLATNGPTKNFCFSPY